MKPDKNETLLIEAQLFIENWIRGHTEDLPKIHCMNWREISPEMALDLFTDVGTITILYNRSELLKGVKSEKDQKKLIEKLIGK